MGVINNNNEDSELITDIVDTIEAGSITMNLENLQNQYNLLLIRYQQSLANYLSYLNKPNLNINNENLVYMKGYAYNGTGTAGESQSTNLQDCIASCSRTKSCTGATFVSNQCLLRTGDSPIVPSTENSYAIVPESVKLLYEMGSINQELISINQQITSLINNAQPLYNSEVSQRFVQQETLLQNYEKLQQEREKILDLLKEYENLDNTQSNDKIKVNHNYFVYILLLILAIAIIALLYYMSNLGTNVAGSQPVIQYGGELGSAAYFIVFVIIILVFLINYLYMNYYY
jgi:hypothetical protein